MLKRAAAVICTLSLVLSQISFVGAFVSDRTPPALRSATPKMNQTNVARNVKISLKFSENIYKSSKFKYIKLTKSNKKVTISSSIYKNYLRITHKYMLSYSSTYVLTIPAYSLKDKAGNILKKAITIKFKTRAKTVITPKPTSTPTPTPTVTPTPTPTSTPTSSIQTSPDPTLPPNPDETFPLKVSPNGRYLTDINNNPYYVYADTGWMMFSYISREDAVIYLESRKSHGINTILTYAAPFYIDRENKEGNLPFMNNDISTPNDEYFDNVDWLINKADEMNMQVVICPVEMQSYIDRYDAFTLESARALGRFMGNRYKNFRNIMWFAGGDIAPNSEEKEYTNAMVEGIREYDVNHIVSFHPQGGKSSSWFFNDEPWLKYNMAQCFSPDSPKAYTLILDDYNTGPVRPTFLVEPPYEDGGTGGSNSIYQARRAVSWGALSGSFGTAYGNGVMYNFGVNSSRDWKPYLEHPGFLHVSNLVDCIKSHEWSKLVPDQAQSVISVGGGYYGDLDYVTTELATDKSFSISYIPTSRAITVNMTKFNGTKVLKWFDMTNNEYTIISTHANTGTVNLPARPLNSSGNEDWVLVIEQPKI